MFFVFFFYGLAFFILGWTVLTYPKKGSMFKLADNLRLLGCFGIIHGVNEWVDMYILISAPAEIAFLKRLNLILLSSSFLLLSQFGVNLIVGSKKKYPALQVLPALLYIAWAAITLLNSRPLLLGSIWARYLLGVSGTLLVSYALFLQITELKESGLTAAVGDLKLGIAAFLLYGILAGLCVPPDGFIPASIFNYTTFLKTTGVPVQIFRAMCAIVITYAMVRILRIFQWEITTRIKNLLEETQRAYGELTTLQETKKSFTQMVVHDFNNPLLAISGNVQLLEIELQDTLSAEQKNTMRSAKYGIQAIKSMVSNLLDIGKMEEGKLVLRREEINLEAFFREIANSMHVLSEQENKTMTVHAPSGLPNISADKEILKRIISNLADNALKFTPPGSDIEIAASYDPGGNEVLVSVKDRGEGISKEFLDRVFDKFFQADSAYTKQKVGKGLGLAFCKMAVEAHGGRIWVESEAGKGSSFYFTLSVFR